MIARRILLALAAALAAGSADAQPTSAPAGSALVDRAQAACQAAPQSDSCAILEAQMADALAAMLLRIASTGNRALFIERVRPFAGAQNPDIRFAAAAALGGLFPAAEETPLLFALFNDPVKRVRGAGLAALRASSDAQARRIIERATSDGAIAAADTPPGVEVLAAVAPPGAVQLRFTDDARKGALVFVTDATPDAVLAAYSAGATAPPFALAELAAPTAAGGVAKPPTDLAAMMQFAAVMGKLMPALKTLPPQQQGTAQVALMSMPPDALKDLADRIDKAPESERGAMLSAVLTKSHAGGDLARWRDPVRFADAKALVLPRPPDPMNFGSTLYLVVYRDVALAKTGVALQLAPPKALTAPAATGAPPDPRSLAAHEVPTPVDTQKADDFLWAALSAGGTAADLQTFVDTFDDSRHLADAKARLDALKQTTPH